MEPPSLSHNSEGPGKTKEKNKGPQLVADLVQVIEQLSLYTHKNLAGT